LLQRGVKDSTERRSLALACRYGWGRIAALPAKCQIPAALGVELSNSCARTAIENGARATKSKVFQNQTVTRAIYATGWDGTVRVVARAANDITVYREHWTGAQRHFFRQRPVATGTT